MDNKFKKHAQSIRSMSAMGPEMMINHLSDVHQDIHEAAPNILPHLHNVAITGNEFLQNKLPKPNQDFIGGPEWKPGKSQMQEWLKYHEAVDDPISILDHIKNATLSKHHLEVLNTVYPDLYQEMQSKVMEHMTPKNMEKMPYSRKIALSKFMGMPLDSSLVAQNILSNQASFAMPGQPQDGQKPNEGKSTLGGMKEIDLGQRSATMIQNDEADQAD